MTAALELGARPLAPGPEGLASALFGVTDLVLVKGLLAGRPGLGPGRRYGLRRPRPGHDAHPALGAGGDFFGETLGHAGIDLDQRLGVLDPDGPDFLLGDFALATDFRQQPFGVGIALAPHIHPEPDAVSHVIARRAFLPRGTFAPVVLTLMFTAGSVLRTLLTIRLRPTLALMAGALLVRRLFLDLFRRRQLGAQQLRQGGGNLAHAMLFQQRIAQGVIFLGRVAGVTAYRALFTRGQLQSGQTVLATGIGGGVATFAMLFASAVGARVLASSRSQAKLDRAGEYGAEPVSMERDKGSVDLIIDSIGGDKLVEYLELIKPGGTIVLYGASAGIANNINLARVFWKQANIVGSTMGTPRDFASMLEFVNRYQIRPVVDNVYALDQFNDAFERLRNADQFGKIVLRP